LKLNLLTYCLVAESYHDQNSFSVRNNSKCHGWHGHLKWKSWLKAT